MVQLSPAYFLEHIIDISDYLVLMGSLIFHDHKLIESGPESDLSAAEPDSGSPMLQVSWVGMLALACTASQ